MKFFALLSSMTALATAAVIPRATTDADEAVVYPASIDLSWVDSDHPSKLKREEKGDADDAVVYPASVDLSWVDSDHAIKNKRHLEDADEAVVYPASVDLSWVDADRE